MVVQTKVFDEYSQNPVEEMNEFIKDVEVVDIKMNTTCGIRGSFFTRYLVIYKEKQNTNFGYNPHI